MTKELVGTTFNVLLMVLFVMGFLQILYDVRHRGRGLGDENSPSSGFPWVKQSIRVPVTRGAWTPNTREFESTARTRDEY